MTENLQSLPMTVVVAGSTSQAGQAVVKALVQSGHKVAAVDLDAERVRDLADSVGNAAGYACDLSDPAAVELLAAKIRADLGKVDGLIHLVGGWRGGRGLEDQNDQDWDFLHGSIVTTLRNTSRTFCADLAESPNGRLAIVSATAAANPTAGGANYAAAKSAAEAWTMAVAEGFERSQEGPQRSAAVVFVVKALLDDDMMTANPHRKFAGFTHVRELGARTVSLFSLPAADLNGRRLVLA